MAKWIKYKIQTMDGCAEAQFPLVVSASRSTDIPAFYADWFFNRLKEGYSAWTNPFNGVKSYVSYRDTRFIVFWSKNPRPLLHHLDYLRERGIGCYIQFTLNDYVAENLERRVPPLDERIETFKLLVEKLGKGHVIWRFDPLVLTDRITIDDLLSKIEHIGNALYGYTEKLVFSFVDIASYRKVRANLDSEGIAYVEWTEALMEEFCARLSRLNRKWGYSLATCGEKIDLEAYGVKKNRCVDDELMIRFSYDDKALMDLLGVEIMERDIFGVVPEGSIELPDGRFAVKKKNNRDAGQREFCGCVISKDIGEYNTCVHSCEYCYANSSKRMAAENYRRHQLNPGGETITGL